MRTNMKYIMTLLLILAFSPSVMAKKKKIKKINFDKELLELEASLIDEKSSSKSSSSFFSKKSKKLTGLGVYAFYSSANDIETDRSRSNNTNFSNQNYQTVDATGEYQTDGAIGFGVDFTKDNLVYTGPVGYGVNVGISYELERTIKRGSNNNFLNTGTLNTNYNNFTGTPSIALFVPYLNANMTYGNSYIFGGVNYSVPQVSDASDEIFEGQIGYQAGFGTELSKWISAEVSYRLVGIKATPQYQNNGLGYTGFVSGQERSGLGLFEQENLTLGGFNMSLKFIF